MFVSTLRSDTLQGARCIHVPAQICVCVSSTERHAARSAVKTSSRVELCLCQLYGATRCKELAVYMYPRRFVFVSDLRSDTLEGARCIHVAAQICVCVSSTERHAARSSVYTCSRADLCLCQFYGRHAARSSLYTCSRADLCLCQLYGATRCKELGVYMKPRRFVFVSALRSDTGREEKKLELEDLNPNQPRTKGKARLVLSARYPRDTARISGSVCCLGSRDRYLKLYYLDLTIRWLVCLETRSKPKMLS